eukprot:676567-Prorocentrum_minimum.AAC.1
MAIAWPSPRFIPTTTFQARRGRYLDYIHLLPTFQALQVPHFEARTVRVPHHPAANFKARIATVFIG